MAMVNVLVIFGVKQVTCACGLFSSLSEDNLICLCISSFVGVCVLPLFFGISASLTCIFIGT